MASFDRTGNQGGGRTAREMRVSRRTGPLIAAGQRWRRGRVEQRDHRPPAVPEDLDRRWRRYQLGRRARWARGRPGIAGRRPAEEFPAPNQSWLAVVEDERPVRQFVERCVVVTLAAGVGIEPFAVELRVDRVGARLSRVDPAPDLDEPVVVLAPAERARPVAGGERGRLVQEEQLGEAAGLHQRFAVPSAEPEPTGDPPFAVVAAADRARRRRGGSRGCRRPARGPGPRSGPRAG